MSWEFLLLLACPLMMVVCMAGMFGGNKNKNKKASSEQSGVSQQELQQLQIKMADLMEQNQKLMKEVQISGQKSSPTGLNEEIEMKSKRDIS